MGIYLTPAYMKPRSRIMNWLIQLALEEQDKAEYVYDGPETAPILRDQTKYYTRYSKLTMKKDLEGNPEQYKLYPDVNSAVIIPIERLVEIATENKEHGKLSGKFNIYSADGEKLVNEVYRLLRSDVRRVVSVPTQWLVWYPEKRLLTRLVFVTEIEGEIVVRPWGSRGLLLEVEKLRLDKVNEWDTLVMKRACLTKNRLNDAWRSLVISEELVAELGELTQEVLVSEEKEQAPGEVGQVE